MVYQPKVPPHLAEQIDRLFLTLKSMPELLRTGQVARVGLRQRLCKLGEHHSILIWKRDPTLAILAIVAGVVIGVIGGQIICAALDNYFHVTLYEYLWPPQ